jgi:hypothetical protein
MSTLIYLGEQRCLVLILIFVHFKYIHILFNKIYHVQHTGSIKEMALTFTQT